MEGCDSKNKKTPIPHRETTLVSSFWTASTKHIFSSDNLTQTMHSTTLYSTVLCYLDLSYMLTRSQRELRIRSGTHTLRIALPLKRLLVFGEEGVYKEGYQPYLFFGLTP